MRLRHAKAVQDFNRALAYNPKFFQVPIFIVLSNPWSISKVFYKLTFRSYFYWNYCLYSHVLICAVEPKISELFQEYKSSIENLSISSIIKVGFMQGESGFATCKMLPLHFMHVLARSFQP